jgi:hypothetical protein
MKKHVLLLALILLLGCPLEAVFVSFKDDKLEAAVSEAVGRRFGLLTQADLQSLLALDVSDLGIQSLSGLEHATNLVFLDVSKNPLSDISPLETLTKLTSLNLDSTNVFQISALAGLLDLESLSLCATEITDIQPLSVNALNGGLGLGSFVNVPCEELSTATQTIDVPILQLSGVNVVCCNTAPVLSVLGTSNLSFGDVVQGTPKSAEIAIENSGTGVLIWIIPTENLPPWIGVNPETGTTKSESDPVSVSVVSGGLAPGFYSTTLDVLSNGGNVLDVPVSMNVVLGP